MLGQQQKVLQIYGTKANTKCRNLHKLMTKTKKPANQQTTQTNVTFSQNQSVETEERAPKMYVKGLTNQNRTKLPS